MPVGTLTAQPSLPPGPLPHEPETPGPCCYSEASLQEVISLATPNYGYEKHHRELPKNQKKQEKPRPKTQRKPNAPQGSGPPADSQSIGDAAGAPDQPSSGAAPGT